LTGSTRHIIGAEELRIMRSTAYLYNVGRGASIDPDALIHALQTGEIAGAGLDVTDPEPLPADSPLWSMPNVILSQHTSGSSPHNADRITEIFAANLRRYLAGEALQQQIDPKRGY
jgi:phosphoglycerate dehydrogenase-like enzyme